jgi:hypothetical protein
MITIDPYHFPAPSSPQWAVGQGSYIAPSATTYIKLRARHSLGSHDHPSSDQHCHQLRNVRRRSHFPSSCNRRLTTTKVGLTYCQITAGHLWDNQGLSAGMGNAPRPYFSARVNDSNQPRQQLPGFREIFCSPLRTGPSSCSYSWPSVHNTRSDWSDGSASSANMQILPANGQSHIGSAVSKPTPHPFLHLSLDVSLADRFSHFASGISLGVESSLPTHPSSPLRKRSDYHGPRVSDKLSPSTQGADTAGPPPTRVASLPHEDTEGDMTRRPNATHRMRNAPPADADSLQCVSRRHVPSGGMCYVFRDGSTCPTVIDGEPVNPLWGTTKAGKARKRLARACL